MNDRKQITQQIVDLIESGLDGETWTPPWVGLERPINRHTGRPYHGGNVLLLWGALLEGGYDHNEWCTYKQAQKAGGQVRKGEKGTQIFLWKFWKKVTDRQSGERVDVDPGEAKGRSDLKVETVPFIRTFHVFNVAQIDDLEPRGSNYDPLDPDSRSERIDSWVERTGADVSEGEKRAAYSPELDVILLPDFERFDAPDLFYSTLFHELTHWTGHEDREDRDLSGRFGDDEYAMEELIAELGSAFLSAEHGVCGDDRTREASYIDGWLRRLGEDEYAVFTVSSAAESAVDYLIDAAGETGGAAEQRAA